MWEVVAESQKTGRKRIVITDDFKTAKRLANKAMDKNWLPKVRQIYTDIILIDRVTGECIVFKEKVPPRQAATYSICWAKTDRESGCLFWPHGTPLPAGWRLIRTTPS